LNDEIRSLGAEVKSAKAHAESATGGGVDSSAFNSVRARFQTAKNEHETIQAQFKTVKAEYDHVKAAFESAQAEHQKAKEAFKNCLAKIQNKQQGFHNKKQKIAAQAGKRSDDVKVRFNPETGKNDVFFGGIGKADGVGHGHAVVDEDGEVVYLRDATLGDRKKAIIKDDPTHRL
jgi:chromosome segregation ATPase